METHRLSDVLERYVRSLKTKGNFVEGEVYLLWHRNLVGGMAIFKDKGFYGLVSSHSDGLFASYVMKKLNILPLFVNEDGTADISVILRIIKSERPVIIIPDGPKGPPFVMKKGIDYIINKKKTIFVEIEMKGLIINTWDRLILPFPFSSVKYTMKTYL